MNKYKWDIYRDSAIPYIGKITMIDGNNETYFVRFLWTRWHNPERAELVIRSMLFCGFDVDNLTKFVESEYSVLEWYTLPTKTSDISTQNEHKPNIEIF
jgi:hypothetical protein